MQAECWRHSLCLTSRVHAGNPTFFRSLTRITPCFCKRLSSLKACQKYTLWNSHLKYQVSGETLLSGKQNEKYFSIALVHVWNSRTNIYYWDNFVHLRVGPSPNEKVKTKKQIFKKCESWNEHISGLKKRQNALWLTAGKRIFQPSLVPEAGFGPLMVIVMLTIQVVPMNIRLVNTLESPF